MFQLERINSNNIAEVAKHYEAEVARYKEYVEKMKDDVESLKKEEEWAISLAEENDKRLESFKGYVLPDTINFEGKEYSKANVATIIRGILDKIELSFSKTPAYHELYKYWLKPSKYCKFTIYNATLSVLGDQSITFKGDKEWTNILVVDEFFKSNNNEHQLNRIETVLCAELHNVVLNALQLHTAADE